MINERKSVIALGTFDGVHYGHKQLLKKCVEIAKQNNENAVVIMFDIPPANFFVPSSALPITSVRQKLDIIYSCGINFATTLVFDEYYANMSADTFLEQIGEKYNVSTYVIGKDYSFGKNRSGNEQYLKDYSQKNNISLCVLDDFYIDTEIASSSLIRKAIQNDDFDLTRKFGVDYALDGIVREGRKIGRTIKYPTMNIDDLENRVTPGDGVYASITDIEGKRYCSISNLGMRPTVNGKHRKLETHIIDENVDMYGKYVNVYLLEKIRQEVKFADTFALKEQISKDVETAKIIFSRY